MNVTAVARRVVRWSGAAMTAGVDPDHSRSGVDKSLVEGRCLDWTNAAIDARTIANLEVRS
jgi:hypothetical protein